MAKKRKKATASKACAKFNPKALGLAIGILWGLGCLLIGIFAMYGYGNLFLNAFASVYKGYAASWGGAVIGGIWGFIDGFIGGYILAWLYNKFC